MSELYKSLYELHQTRPIPKLTSADYEAAGFGAIKYELEVFSRIIASAMIALNTSSLEGVKWLDLCCGGDGPDGFYPYLPLMVSICGGISWGLDVASQPKNLSQYYTHIVKDVYDFLNFSSLGLTDRFDVVSCTTTASHFNPSPLFLSTALKSDHDWRDFEAELLTKSCYLLNPGGIILVDGKKAENITKF